MRKLLVLWAAIFIAAHVPALPASLGDLESVNFGLAVREFDVTADQPHPPGSTHFVGLAKAATAALLRLGDPLNAAHALAIVNITGAAVALIAVFWFARALGYSTRRALGASVVTGTIPLYWFSASRPLNDFPGLALAVLAQALLVPAVAGLGRSARSLWQIAAGAMLAGAAAGFAMQSALLTFPLLAAVLMSRELPGWTRLTAAAAAVAGLLTWLVPLLVDTGAGDYLRAIRDATVESGRLDRLAADPSLRLFGEALQETFVDPFGSPLLAAVVLGAGLLGIALAATRERHILKALTLCYAPYLIFHLLFQDTLTNRHAIPLLPAIALLFVIPFEYMSVRAVLPAAAGAATAGLLIAVPALQAHAAAESPGFALIRDLHRLPRAQETVLAMHTQVADDLRRHQDWEAIPPMRTLPATPDYEWLELVELWQEGYEGPIWFLADPRRTDLRQIDPQQRRLMRQYGWPESNRPFTGGIRPNRIDWYFIQRPGWFLGRGWAVSPEIGGLISADRDGAGRAPAVAWVRRRPQAATMMLGGRHNGNASDPPVVVRVRVDGRQVDEWPIRPGPFVFMRPVLPEELEGTATYGLLEIEATWTGSGPAPIVFDQFDFQSIDGTIVAYDEGWWQEEYQQRSGQTWRWTAGEAKLWLFNPGRDLTLVISGEDPTRHYRGGTEMTVLVGEREVGRFTLTDHFTQAVRIPVEPLSVARGRVTLRVADTHVPGRLRGLIDQRELGLRIFDVSVY